MREGLPFDDLLHELRARGLELGIGERLAFARVLSRYDGTSREELRDVVSGLLARSDVEVALVREVFDSLYPAEVVDAFFRERARRASPRAELFEAFCAGEGAPRPTPAGAPLPVGSGVAAEAKRAEPAPAAPKSAGGAWWRWPLRGALVLALVAGFLWPLTKYSDTHVEPPPPLPELEAAVGADEQELPPVAPLARPEGCAPRRDAPVGRWPLPTLALAGAAALTLAGLGVDRYRRRLREWAVRLLKRRLAELPGPRAYAAPEPAAEGRPARGDLAAILEGALAEPGPGRLDVERSVDGTVRAGLRPTLVFRARSARRSLVLLRDVARESAPWRAKMDAFERALERRGVAVERRLFDRDPSRVAARPLGPWAPLDELAAERRGLPLIVLGTGDGLGDPDPVRRARAREALAAWPARALLTPVEDPDLWPEGLLDPGAPIAAFPMSREGLLAAAEHVRALRSHDGERPRLRAEDRPPIDPDDVMLLRALLALAPAPTFELAELVRRRFLPRAPEELVLAAEPLIREAEAGPRAGAGARPAAAAALRWLRAADPEHRMELEARRFLLAEIERRRPAAEGSAAHLRWRADVLVQRLHLAADAGERARVAAELVELAGTPIGADLGRAIEREAVGARLLEVPGERLDTIAGVSRRLGARARRSAAGARPGRLSEVLASLFPGARALVAVIASSALAAALLNGLVFTPRAPDLDGSTNLLWTRADVRAALCAFDDFYDVAAIGDDVVGLAAAGGEPAAGAPRGRFFAFRLSGGRLLRAFAAREIAVVPLSGERTGAIRLGDGDELEVFLAAPDPTGAPGLMRGALHRLDAQSLAGRSAEGVFEAEGRGWAPYFDEDGVLVHYSRADGRRARGGALAEPSSLARARAERDLALARRSGGIVPGTAREVIDRLVDPGAPRRTPSLRGAPCPAPRTPCAGDCVDTSTDPAHCGACGAACAPGQWCADGACAAVPTVPTGAPTSVPTASASGEGWPLPPCPDPRSIRCGDACVDPRTSPFHCGACDQNCFRPGMSHLCVAGACERCRAGFDTCEPYADPCGTNLGTDPENCGRCGNACPSGPHVRPACRAGACSALCDPGYGDCDADPSNGCEASLISDPRHCGSCGRACGRGIACVAGACDEAPVPCRQRCNAAHGRCITGCKSKECTADCDAAQGACLRDCEIRLEGDLPVPVPRAP